MIYNFNLGIGWASSGVEYAQAYRANIFRKINQEARFVFTDMFINDNLADMTRNIGFEDEEIIWLYTFFSDFEVAPVTYTIDQLKATTGNRDFNFSREGKIGRIEFSGSNNFYRVMFVNDKDDYVHRVEMVQNGILVRKDFYTYGRVFSEYYAPLDNRAHLYQRRFFNSDGTVAYEQIIDGDSMLFKFDNAVFTSKEEFVGYMVRQMNLTKDDIVIVDRTTGIGQAILQNAYPAKIGIVVHADHFSEGGTDDDCILWNNYYEYSFSMNRHIDFYVTATDAQNNLMKEQFEKYLGVSPRIETIPVGSIDKLKYPIKPRKKHSLITASRLASEKHIDWLISAVAEARNEIPDLTLDIYGKGGEEDVLSKQIASLGAQDYIRLMGHADLSEVYLDYEAYLSASTSEGFGLTILEALGSGLPVIGFDVRYGNQTFIDHGKNGYKIPYSDAMEAGIRQKRMVDCIKKIFLEDNIDKFSAYSYEKAKMFLTSEVEKKWKETIETTI